jgi:hypothetical protein
LDIFFLGGEGVAGVKVGEALVNLLLAKGEIVEMLDGTAETCAEPCRSMVANTRQFIVRIEIHFQTIHNGFGYNEAKVGNVLGYVSF